MHTHPEHWTVRHTRTGLHDDSRLETVSRNVPTAADAFELMCAMACLNAEQRREHGLFYYPMDTMELAVVLEEMTGDKFEAEQVETCTIKLPAEIEAERATAIQMKIEERYSGSPLDWPTATPIDFDNLVPLLMPGGMLIYTLPTNGALNITNIARG